MNKCYDVIIASPGEKFDQHYVWSITQTIKYLEENNISWLWLNNYSSHVGQARQRIIDDLKNYSYNKLFWIDSDIHWNESQFIKLYESDHDMVSGCYLTTAGVLAAQDDEGYSIPLESLLFYKNIEEVRSCGFGFVCMKRGIIESIKDPMKPYGEYLNEDISFCLRVKSKLNIKIMLDTTVRLDHFRTMSLGWGVV
jgi:hypothetical protein